MVFLESTNGSKFLYLFIGIDESEYEDNKGGYYFQQSMSLGCVQIPESLNNTNSEIQSYELKEDFLCTYYSSYEILQLGNLYNFFNLMKCILLAPLIVINLQSI